MTNLSAAEALNRLRAGNSRFAAGLRSVDTLGRSARPGEHLHGQRPFAAILGCSDSRVPVEIVFDQGLGDLFVIRVAGNVVAPTQIGSVEFAAERFGTRLVVVLGHTGCGAVTATLEELARPGGRRSPNLHSIVERVRPAVEPLLAGPAAATGEELARRAVRANIAAAVAALRHGSELIERLVAEDGLRVVGAEYDLASGEVTFLPEPGPD
ncbi:MAG: carbonic anhydrase [Planctomycetota bacterium]|nr:MAG: carbonic anhydrase [Planctomycetota bacterium]